MWLVISDIKLSKPVLICNDNGNYWLHQVCIFWQRFGENDYEKEGDPLVDKRRQKRILNKRQKELEIFLKYLETYPLNNVILGRMTLLFHDKGDTGNDWFRNRSTK